MPYEINKTDDIASSITVADGQINASALSITLVGRGYDGLGQGYGELMQENLVHVMENFASVTPPLNPIYGQLWFNPADESLNVHETTGGWRDMNDFYDGSIFDIAIAADAQIQISKLEDGSLAQIIVVNGSGVPEYMDIVGDVLIDQLGNTTLQSNTVNTAELVTGLYLNALQVDASTINVDTLNSSVTNVLTSINIAATAILTVDPFLNIVSPTATVEIGSPNNLATLYTTTTPKHLFNNIVHGGAEIWSDSAFRITGTDTYLNLTTLALQASGSPRIELRSTSGNNPYIDFSNDNSVDYDMRIQLDGDNQLDIIGGALHVTAGDIFVGSTTDTVDRQISVYSNTSAFFKAYGNGDANAGISFGQDAVNGGLMYYDHVSDEIKIGRKYGGVNTTLMYYHVSNNHMKFTGDITINTGTLHIPRTTGNAITFDNGDAHISVHDGYGNFNFNYGVADDGNRYRTTGYGATRLTMNAEGQNGIIEFKTGVIGTAASIISWKSMTFNSDGVLSAPTGNITTINASIINASTGSITNLTTTNGSITNLTTSTGSITNLTTTTGNITTINASIINASTGSITNLTTTNGSITTLNTTTGNITTINASTINASTGNITNLTTTNGSITTLNTTTGNITNLTTTTGNITTINASTINTSTGNITNLTTTNGSITTLNTTTGNITTLNVATIQFTADAALGEGRLTVGDANPNWYSQGVTGGDWNFYSDNSTTLSSLHAGAMETHKGYAVNGVLVIDKARNISARYINSSDNIYVGSTSTNADRVIRVHSSDAYKCGFEAYGSSQGTGYLYVGQSYTYGGGIAYNGDGIPSFSAGERSDTIQFYRTDNGVRTTVFQYPHNGNQVDFAGNLLVKGGRVYINDTSTYITEGTGNRIRIQSNYGYLDLGAPNGTWAEFATDRSKFYFAKSVHVNGTLHIYNTNTSLSKNQLYMQFGVAIYSGDEWLRLNHTTSNASPQHTNGIYCGTSLLRTDGEFQVGSSGTKFRVQTNGNTSMAGYCIAGGYLQGDGVYTGKNGGGDSWINFYDDNNNTWRELKWDDSSNEFQVEANNGIFYKIWHEGNDGPGSGLNADKLDGYELSTSSTPNTVTRRDPSGDIAARLFRSEYDSTNPTINFIMTQIDTGSNNYIRPSTIAQLKNSLGKMNDADKLDGLTSTDFLRANVDDTLSANIICGNTARDHSVVGTYDSNKTQQVWAMGTAYRCSSTGSGFGSLYGIAYKYNSNAGGHGYVVAQNGVEYCSLGNNIWTRGDVTAFSDRRVKTNLEVIPNALDKVKKLHGYTFNRVDTDDANKRHTGVIAQEVLEVLPEVVSQNEEGMYSVAYGNMVGLLIEAIKEQQETIDKLSTRLANLEK